jgi:ribosome-associated protein
MSDTISELDGRDADATGTQPRELAFAICELAADRKAQEIVELDVSAVLGYTDYFVIATGGTDRQTRAIHDAIVFGLKHDHGVTPRRVEGLGQAHWVLLDYLDVVVHLFTPQTRDFYRLEQLWGEAPVRRHEQPQPEPLGAAPLA